MNMKSLAERIDTWLPQTQCTQCGYPRCRLYAEAVARGEADINQCPPGGEVTIHALAELRHVAPKPVNPAYGVHKPRLVAVIDEQECIGCTLCLEACPVDAILGASKKMHTVIADECTGCELCVAPCPVDCIEMIPVHHDGSRDHWPWPDYSGEQVDRARMRTEARLRRLERRRRERAERLAARKAARQGQGGGRLRAKTKAEIKEEIRSAVQRARAKKAQQTASFNKNRA